MSYDPLSNEICVTTPMSQSLWNRAMSYDVKKVGLVTTTFVSIPLEQGNVLRHDG